MRTLHVSYRVTNLAASLEFYTAIGYARVGRVDVGNGASLTMLKFPGEEVVTLELVHRPADGPVDIGTGFSHLPIQVDDLKAKILSLAQAGFQAGPVEFPGGPDGPQTAWITDPDGYRLELVQWPAGHPDGITAADFSGSIPIVPIDFNGILSPGFVALDTLGVDWGLARLGLRISEGLRLRGYDFDAENGIPDNLVTEGTVELWPESAGRKHLWVLRMDYLKHQSELDSADHWSLTTDLEALNREVTDWGNAHYQSGHTAHEYSPNL